MGVLVPEERENQGHPEENKGEERCVIWVLMDDTK